THPGPHEDIPSFDEWKKKVMEEEKEKQSHTLQSVDSSLHQVRKTQKNLNNYASVECGAKILATNPEAKSTSAILMENMDHYMLNPCSAKIWFVIELCEPVQVKQIDIANFELFSSTPQDFLISISDRYPTREWNKLGKFHARDERTVQSFPLDEQMFAKFLKMFAKYIKVELLSHFGKEHFCPLSLIRVFGTSMVEEYEEIAESHYNPEVPGIIDEDSDYPIDYGSKMDTDSKNIIGSATDAILSMVNIAAKVLGGSNEAEVSQSSTFPHVTDAANHIASEESPPPTLIPVVVPLEGEDDVEEHETQGGGDEERETVGLAESPAPPGLAPPVSIVTQLGPEEDQSPWLEELRAAWLHAETRTLCGGGGAALGRSCAARLPELALRMCLPWRDRDTRRAPRPPAPPESAASPAPDAPDEDSMTAAAGARVAGPEHAGTLPEAGEVNLSETSLGSGLLGERCLLPPHPEQQAVDVTPSHAAEHNAAAPPDTEIVAEASPPDTFEDQAAAASSAASSVLGAAETNDGGSVSNATTAATAASTPVEPSQTQTLQPTPRDAATQAVAVLPPTQHSETVETVGDRVVDTVDRTLPASTPAGELLAVEESAVQGAGNGSAAAASEFYAEASIAGEVALAPGGLVHGSSQKESVFMRLNNRIKALEVNMSLSSRYLEELSQRYRKQMEEMQKAFNKTIIKLQNTSRLAEEQDKRQSETINQMQAQLGNLSDLINNLSQATETLQAKVSERDVSLLISEMVCVLLVFVLCWQRCR
uniref:SUN domain-containing protein n=1 Tax=Petromyzon marinus TaxID=7757 RepID=S4R5K5_PETMA